jgi:hypothetical protein
MSSFGKVGCGTDLLMRSRRGEPWHSTALVEPIKLQQPEGLRSVANNIRGKASIGGLHMRYLRFLPVLLVSLS